jgi:hypothetical protein
VAAETTVMPFAEFLVDQVQVIRFCARVFEVAYRFHTVPRSPTRSTGRGLSIGR